MHKRTQWAALIIAACLAVGCFSQSSQQLADVVKLPDNLLNKDQQQAKINDLEARQRAKEAQVEKEIQETK
jgi:hypothetical protein